MYCLILNKEALLTDHHIPTAAQLQPGSSFPGALAHKVLFLTSILRRLAQPEKYMFSLSKKYFLDQSIQKKCCLIPKKEALLITTYLLQRSFNLARRFPVL